MQPPTKDPGGIAAQKKDMRLLCRQERQSISQAKRELAGERAAGHLIALEALPRSGVIGLFAAIRGEIPTEPAIKTLTALGRTLAYPRVHRGSLTFHLVDREELFPGRFGVPEPGSDSLPIEFSELSAVVVPGLAFDRRGGRLGWGRGYYDATLDGSVPSIGLGYASQILNNVPMGPADVYVDYIVTELGAIDCTHLDGSGTEIYIEAEEP